MKQTRCGKRIHQRADLSCCLLSWQRAADVNTNCWPELTESKRCSAPSDWASSLKYQLIISDGEEEGLCVTGPFWPRSACLLNGCWGQSGRSITEVLWDEIHGCWRRSSALVSFGILRQSGDQTENTAVYSRQRSTSATPSGGENLWASAGWSQPAAAPPANHL